MVVAWFLSYYLGHVKGQYRASVRVNLDFNIRIHAVEDIWH